MNDDPKHEAPRVYGLLAEFDGPDALVEAARAVRRDGFTRTDAFSPYPIEDLDAALGIRRTRLPAVVLTGALIGGLGAYLMQYYAAVIDYPWDVGGRPLHSWPMFIPITFECAVLGAGLAAVVGMIVRNGLPRLHHPLFGVPQFDRASQDRFFLCIEADDPKFDRQATRARLDALGATEVIEVVE